MPTVLSIQSQVADGHVGNSAAVFPMQRLGIEVIPVHTLQFSNHPGHGGFGGNVFASDHVGAVLDGLERHGALARVDAILTGYLGSAEIAVRIAQFVERAKIINPRLVVICDPVIGDRNRGLYVSTELAATLRDRLVPLADVLVPNAFELEWLSGQAIESERDIKAAAGRLGAGQRRAVVATSLDFAELGPDRLATALIDRDGCKTIAQKRFPRQFSGAGDCFAALLVAYLLRTGDIKIALPQAVVAVSAVLVTTLRLRRDELALVAAQRNFRLRPTQDIARALKRLT